MIEEQLGVRARVLHVHATRDQQGVLSSCEFGLEFLDVSEEGRDELRRFLFDWMADDSSSHGWDDR